MDLNPDSWHEQVPGERWFIKFYQQGCRHCERMRPMWDAVALRATGGARVGRVDCSAHNGIGRSFGVDRFPTVMIIDSDGSVYEFTGMRGLPPLLEFARGGFRKQSPKMLAPATLLPNAPDWWLLCLVLWRPIAISFGLALGLALALKCCSWIMLRLLRPSEPKTGAVALTECGKKAE